MIRFGGPPIHDREWLTRAEAHCGIEPQRTPIEGICSSRLNDRFAVQDGTNCPISIGTPSCCGANDGSNASEQIGSPLGTESTCNFAVCGCGPQFPLAAIVIRWNVRMLQEGEKVAAHLAV